MRHGHVTPNTDGSRARCGGPAFCKDCQSELAEKTMREQIAPDFDKQMATREQLKPCPFCGSSDVANVSAGVCGPSNRWHAGDKIFAVNCKQCGASVPNRYKNSLVVSEWNKRAEPQT